MNERTDRIINLVLYGVLVVCGISIWYYTRPTVESLMNMAQIIVAAPIFVLLMCFVFINEVVIHWGRRSANRTPSLQRLIDVEQDILMSMSKLASGLCEVQRQKERYK